MRHSASAVHGAAMGATTLVLDDLATVAAHIMRVGVALVLPDGKPVISRKQGIAYII